MSHLITILGAGESGTGAALLAKAKGYTVFVSDNGIIDSQYKYQLINNRIEFEEGQHSKKKILDSRLVIKSPGIPESASIVKALREADVKIIDEIEFAFSYTRARIIAITGTNGKTTTTLLTYHLLKEAGVNVGLAGNIGHNFSAQVIKDEFDYFVLEMSSFQLDSCHLFRPFIAVLLNITPDHMDRYDYRMDKYVDSKFRIVQNADEGDHFIYFSDNSLIAEKVQALSLPCHHIDISLHDNASCYFDGKDIHLPGNIRIAGTDIPLLGTHNAINTMAAVNAAAIPGVDLPTILKGLKTFKNAPHRLEYVDTIRNVHFINDSKATNVDAVKYALESFSDPLVWIAGGVDKGNKYDLIMEQVNAKVRALICLGKDNKELRDAFHDQIIKILETESISDAVTNALAYAEANDVVLFSPACASFDLFKNYKDRGDQFKSAVRELKAMYERRPSNQ